MAQANIGAPLEPKCSVQDVKDIILRCDFELRLEILLEVHLALESNSDDLKLAIRAELFHAKLNFK